MILMSSGVRCSAIPSPLEAEGPQLRTRCGPARDHLRRVSSTPWSSHSCCVLQARRDIRVPVSGMMLRQIFAGFRELSGAAALDAAAAVAAAEAVLAPEADAG